MATAGSDSLVTAPIYQVKAEFFKTLGHPARIRVLEVLGEGSDRSASSSPRSASRPPICPNSSA